MQSNIEDFKLKSLCRACMNTVTATSITFIKNSELIERYFACTSIQVNFADGLSLNLCEKCHELVNDFYHFRKMCVETQEKMYNSIFGRPNLGNFEGPELEAINIKQCKVEIDSDILDEYRNECDKNDQSTGLDPVVDRDSQIKSNHERIEDEDVEDFTDDGGSNGGAEESEDSEDNGSGQNNKSIEKRNTRGRKSRKNDNSDKVKKKKKLGCHICNKKFHQQIRLDGHLREHEGLKPCVCPMCNKELSNFKAYYRHIQFVHGERKLYPCTVNDCDKSYKTNEGLIVHVRKFHNGIKSAPFICELCGKSLTTKSALEKHKNVHAGIKPFACNLCPKSYPTRYKLNIHLLRHEGIKRYTCSLCGLKKTTGHELNIHMRTHTKEKTYKCDFCSNLFSNFGNLSRHVALVHMKIKNFRCTYCDMTFGKAETLKHHVMRHTGEKPHECSVCGKRFIQSIALQTHMKTHNKPPKNK